MLPVLGAMAGFALELAFGWRPVEAIHTRFEFFFKLSDQLAGWWNKLAKTPEANLLAAPTVGFILGWGLAALGPVKHALRQAPGLRDPPPFARVDLAAEEDAPFRTTGWIKPAFIGRERELGDLIAWAKTLDAPFGWKGLVGRSGIGKSRLAVRWLAAMDRAGWDVGVVDPAQSIPSRWRARRPTALVIDEAQLLWDRRLGAVLDALFASARPRAPVRVLVLNATEPQPERRDGPTSRLTDATRAESLRLGPLDETASADLWREATRAQPELAKVEHDGAGLPLAIIRVAHGALEGRSPSYWRELADNATKLVPALAEPRGQAAAEADRRQLALVLFTALAGPLDRETAQQAFGDFGRYDLSPVLPESDLDRGLPAIAPEDLKLELLIGCAELLGHDGLSTAKAAMSANPGAAEASLGALWMTRPEVGDAASERAKSRVEQLRRMQETFDALHPERVDALRSRAKALLKASATEDLPIETFERVELDLRGLLDVRPFDQTIRQAAISMAVNAIGVFGAAERWTELEAWDRRLQDLTSGEQIDGAARLAKAQAAGNAILRYGEASRWTEMERWGGRLRDLVSSEAFSGDPAVRRVESVAALHAISLCSLARRFSELEAWGARLQALCRTSPFDRDLAIRRNEAKAVVKAIAAYGDLGSWPQLEAWGERLRDLVGAPPFVDDPTIRLEEAHAVFYATDRYGRAMLWSQLEGWAAQLRSLVRTKPFDRDPAIRLREAQIAFNAIVSYAETEHYDEVLGGDKPAAAATRATGAPSGRSILLPASEAIDGDGEPERWKGLALWGKQLQDLVRTEPFDRDPAVRLLEAQAASVAVFALSRAQRWADAEAWTQRLLDLVDTEPFSRDPDFRTAEAAAATGAIAFLGDAGRWSEMEWWGDRLAKLVGAEPFDRVPAIRVAEAQAACNAIMSYGDAKLWTKLEDWGRRLHDLIHTEPFGRMSGVGYVEARTASAVIGDYAKAGEDKAPDRRRWFERLARIARWFPVLEDVQRIARNHGVSFVEQELKGWPYGRDRGPKANPDHPSSS